MCVWVCLCMCSFTWCYELLHQECALYKYLIMIMIIIMINEIITACGKHVMSGKLPVALHYSLPQKAGWTVVIA